MAFCPKCGNQVNDGVSFCNNCGANLGASAPRPSAPPPPRPGYNAGYNPGYNAGYNPGYNPGPAAHINRTPVKTDYNLGMFILLNLVTCGIYGYYIIYQLARDVNQMCAEDGDQIGGLAMYIVMSFLTCGIYNIYWLYKIQNRMCAAGPRYNVMVTENGGTVLMWYILGMFLCVFLTYVGYNITFKTANKLGMAYNSMYFY